jgi:hypothetical protein
MFNKVRDQEGKTGPVRGLVLLGGGRLWGNSIGGWICCKCFVYIYVNRKMIPVETIPRMGGGWIKESDGGGEFNYDIFVILCTVF